MFGYVNADKPNMLMKDYAAYRAFYCGLCKTLGRRFSQLTRFTVNYDIAFLTLLAHNYRKIQPEFKEERCIAHPVGKKFPVVQDNEAQRTVADINIILAYYKIKDDINDGGGVKYGALKAFVNNKFKKCYQNYPELCKSVGNHYERLNVLEKAGEKNIDKLADCFAGMMVDVGRAAAGKNDDNLDALCYNLGRWIYFIDAVDDLKKDAEEGKFNPFLAGAALDKENEDAIYEKAAFNLKTAVAEIRRAYDKMDISVAEGPLSNIIYCGLRQRTEMILNNRGAQCKRTRLMS